MTGHEDSNAVVVVAAPVVDLLHGIATGEDRSGRDLQALVEDARVRIRRMPPGS